MNEISLAEKNAMAVSYEVMGSKVELDIPFIKKYLVRGKAEYTTDQELMLFMQTCRAQGLNPLVNGEVYLIKYDSNSPAQMVVGKDAFLRRAYSDPSYIGKHDGITVKRGNEIVQKEGTCVYPGETLIGGWCRVYYTRAGRECTAFKEVSLAEYDKGRSNWRSIPATMINKVAISQCIRDAYPKEYAGLYSEDEMIASGAIPASVIDADGDVIRTETVVSTQEETITKEQRQELFRTAKERYGEGANDKLKEVIAAAGYTSTQGIKCKDYQSILDALYEQIAEPDPN